MEKQDPNDIFKPEPYLSGFSDVRSRAMMLMALYGGMMGGTGYDLLPGIVRPEDKEVERHCMQCGTVYQGDEFGLFCMKSCRDTYREELDPVERAKAEKWYKKAKKEQRRQEYKARQIELNKKV